MNRMRLDDKQLQAAHPENSVWVSANAGAGKTQVLANRIARLLLAGAEPASILCLTYTNAGAAEMAHRIHATLGKWAGLQDDALAAALNDIGFERPDVADLKRARQLFALALDTPGGFKIQTIHGFCERILQLFPVEAGMSPGFEVLDESTRAELLNAARDEVLGAADVEPGSELAQALQVVDRHATSDSLKDLIDEMQASTALLEAANSNVHAGMIDEQLRGFFGLGESPNKADLIKQLVEADDRSLLATAEELALEGGPKNANLGALLKQILATSTPAARAETIRNRMFLDKAGDLRARPRVYKTKTPAAQGRLQTVVDAEYDRLHSLLQKHDELVRIEATKALAVVAGEVIKRYAVAKARRAAYDFDDLIERTRSLLTDPAQAAWVLYKLDKAIQHVLIDEAQDTSPPQWQIMRALTEEFFAGEGQKKSGTRTFFVVGDQKQSIFSFQGADVRIFEESQAYFERRGREARQPVQLVPLTVSYRSLPAVLAAVDEVFKEGMPARQTLGIAGADGLDHVAFRGHAKGTVELWPLVNAEDSGEFDKWRAPRNVREQASPQLRLARQIATAIASWIGKRKLSGEDRAVLPSDILLLFRRRSAMFDMMIAALREAGVPVAGTDRLKPVENIAVEDMLALIRVMVLPQDDYALACLLKSPLVSTPFSEQELFELCCDRGRESSWQRLAASELPAAKTCRAELEGWRSLAQQSRPYEFISRVLMARKAHILARLGGEAGDALRAMCEQALAYEREYGASLTGFAEWFRAENSEIKRDMEKGEGEVRLMTVHGAKGLQANIVMLPDAADYNEKDRDKLMFVSALGGDGDVPLWKLSRTSRLLPSPAIDRLKADLKDAMHSEYTRLLYVAMTRARDELYICGAHQKDEAPPESWYGMVSAALRFDGVMRGTESPIAGLVWRSGQDPEWFETAETQQSPSTAQEIPACLRESFAARTVDSPHMLSPSRMAHGGGRAFNAKGARAGKILHRILEVLPDKPPSERRSFVERRLQQGGLGQSHADRLMAVLDLPELQALFSPESSAETAIGTRLPDGTAFNGVIDRLVVRDNDILLLDYKSDSLVPERLEAGHPHFNQLASYCFALQKAYPGKPVRAGLLWLSTLRLEWLEPAELAQAIAAMHGGQPAAP